jgi:hypothetical protein
MAGHSQSVEGRDEQEGKQLEHEEPLAKDVSHCRPLFVARIVLGIDVGHVEGADAIDLHDGFAAARSSLSPATIANPPEITVTNSLLDCRCGGTVKPAHRRVPTCDAARRLGEVDDGRDDAIEPPEAVLFAAIGFQLYHHSVSGMRTWRTTSK